MTNATRNQLQVLYSREGLLRTDDIERTLILPVTSVMRESLFRQKPTSMEVKFKGKTCNLLVSDNSKRFQEPQPKSGKLWLKEHTNKIKNFRHLRQVPNLKNTPNDYVLLSLLPAGLSRAQ